MKPPDKKKHEEEMEDLNAVIKSKETEYVSFQEVIVLNVARLLECA